MLVCSSGYLLADGKLDDLTELQYNAVPYIKATMASIENGTYDGLSNSESEISIEDYTDLRLNGKTTSSRDSKRAAKYYTEETDVKWVSRRESVEVQSNQ